LFVACKKVKFRLQVLFISANIPDMKKQTAIDFFGSKARLARAFASNAKPRGLSRATISNWGDVVPFARAIQLEKKTFGRLKVDHSCYPYD
jgi:hypothetical protein